MMEIFDAKKEPKTPTMTIYIEKENQNVDDVKRIAESIKEVIVKDIIKSTVVDVTDLIVRCKLDTEKLKRYSIESESIPKIVKVRDGIVTIERDELVVKSKRKDISNIYALKYNILRMHIGGIKNITQVIVMKEGDEWVINTLGSNLKKILEVKGVDKMRTTTNNIFEIYHVLGVEAARNAIISEAKHTIEEQGLGVDIRYIMLLADLMTVKGDIRAIGRYGIAGQKASVLARAAFEETKKHFIEASVRGEMDEIKETIENIMLNQVASIGTGSFDLTGRIPSVGKKQE
jgi:DNA-directed RNA polymerase subunit A"